MRRVVSLLYRQAVKAKAEGLFFKVSGVRLFDLWPFSRLTNIALLGAVFFTYTLGVHIAPLQDNFSRSEGPTTRAAIQGPHKSY